MKITHTYLLICLVLFSNACTEQEKSKSTAVEEYKPIHHKYVKTDTLRFSKDSSRMIVSGVREIIQKNDSVKLTPLDVLYYKNGKQIASYSTEIESEGNEELTHYFENTDTNGNSCERFFTATLGYAACGYTQHHHTFSIDDESIYLLAKHESSADGAYGYGIKFSDLCKDVKATKLSSVYVSSMPSETDEMLIYLSYTDSVEYTFNGKSWEQKAITEKGKEFRTGQERL